jgi:hypothetical protein
MGTDIRPGWGQADIWWVGIQISESLSTRYVDHTTDPDIWPILDNRYPQADDQISAPRPDKQISPTALPDIPIFAKQIIRHPHSRISDGTPIHRYLVGKW